MYFWFDLFFQENYEITHIVIPEQQGDDVSCTPTSRGYAQLVQAQNQAGLIQLGWIHVCIYWFLIHH